ncbi:hypothetical protein M422DRAFT_274825 [Sphaerobolus stellatus SS14]|uniref:Uncharacterized protein n=1 Tax=Sphaerobolus stellatus (strain SS14) TaxID=990650 RepID=A0A0C9U5R9_SPHS4|nr:hypothetical protein M422DRAFT_274825 [Sphaerobolus stellatus SS14]
MSSPSAIPPKSKRGRPRKQPASIAQAPAQRKKTKDKTVPSDLSKNPTLKPRPKLKTASSAAIEATGPNILPSPLNEREQEATLALLQMSGNDSSAPDGPPRSSSVHEAGSLWDELEQDIEELQEQDSVTDLPRSVMPVRTQHLHSIVADSSDISEEEFAEPAWDIPFKIPTAPKTCKTIFISSDMKWKDAQVELSDALGIARKHLKISAKLSTTPQTQLAEELTTETQWRMLVSKATKSYQTETRKKTKAKEVFISIVDLHKEEADARNKGKKTKEKEKAKGGKRKHESDSEEEGEEGSDVPAAHSKSDNDWVLKLQVKYKCTDHDGFCFFQPGWPLYSHLTLTHSGISAWGTQLSEKIEGVDVNTPPKEIELKPRPPKAARSSAHTPYGHFALPPGYMPPPPLPPYGYGYAPQPYQPYAHLPPMPPTPRKAKTTILPTSSPAESRPLLSSEPDPFRPSSEMTMTTVTELLEKLQKSAYGEDGQSFTYYDYNFRSQGYTRANQIASLPVEKIKAFCLDIPDGTAELIIKAAQFAVKEQKGSHKSKKPRY